MNLHGSSNGIPLLPKDPPKSISLPLCDDHLPPRLDSPPLPGAASPGQSERASGF